MKEELAIEANKRLWKGHGELNDLVWLSKERCDEQEYRAYRRQVAEAMASVGDVMRLIYHEFPHVEPKSEGDVQKLFPPVGEEG